MVNVELGVAADTVAVTVSVAVSVTLSMAVVALVTVSVSVSVSVSVAVAVAVAVDTLVTVAVAVAVDTFVTVVDFGFGFGGKGKLGGKGKYHERRPPSRPSSPPPFAWTRGASVGEHENFVSSSVALPATRVDAWTTAAPLHTGPWEPLVSCRTTRGLCVR